MLNMIYSSERAEQLNKKVCSVISEKLYFFCNPEDQLTPVYGKDAIFIRAVNNLYKYLNDTSVVFNHLEDIYCGSKESFDYEAKRILEQNVNLKKLRIIKGTVDALRAVEAHNNSEKNGFIEARNIESCKQWISSVIGKKTIESASDYDPLISRLEVMGDELYEIADSYIELIAQSGPAKKAEIIQRWEDAIFYSYSVKENFVINQLGYFYYLQSKNQTVSSPNSRRAMRGALRKWVCNYFDAPLMKINQLTAIETRVLNAAKLSGEEKQEKLKKIREDRARQQQILDSEEACLREELKLNTKDKNGNLPAITYEDYYTYFRKKKLMVLLKEELEKTGCNMLPDVLIQNVIAREFAGIPLPTFR